jgi:outer membrane protein assembly factor BamB
MTTRPFRTCCRRITCFVLLSAIVFPAAAGADWLQFRGPDGQGRAAGTSLPVRWSETENVAWKSPIPGDGWSSPVVAGELIFLTTAVSPAAADAANGASPDPSKARSLRVLCLNADDGSLIWDREVFQQQGSDVQIHRKNSHASPTPVIDGGRLYVHFGPAGTACLSLDGEILWKTQALTFKPVHGNGGSPAVFEDTLIVTCDGGDRQFVAGLSTETGEVKWTTSRDTEAQKGFSFSTPTLLNVNGTTQAICPGSGAVVAYDPRTGKELWRVRYGEGYSVVPRPVYGGGLVFVSSGYNSAVLYAIDPSGSGDVTDTHVRWTLKRGVPKTPSMLIVGDELYMVDDGGVASCLDVETGEVHWKQRLGGKYSASPFFGDGRIYFQSETGTTTVVAPGTEYRELAVNELGDGDRTFASFAVVDDAILLRSESHLYRIESSGD